MTGFAKDPFVEYPSGQLEYRKQLFADNYLRYPHPQDDRRKDRGKKQKWKSKLTH
ncbi:MAG: hypothetical protein MUE44_34785 [Oscillatoriaceae cyanobacterium Prado104]|jgi:hypothetical protein|nr:hypothetical protein [Oscillatoriaceae cyanobacterium Prado104]